MELSRTSPRCRPGSPRPSGSSRSRSSRWKYRGSRGGRRDSRRRRSGAGAARRHRRVRPGAVSPSVDLVVPRAGTPRSSARRAPARPPCSPCSCASSNRSQARSGSTGARTATRPPTRCVPASPMSSRRRRSWPARSATTSAHPPRRRATTSVETRCGAGDGPARAGARHGADLLVAVQGPATTHRPRPRAGADPGGAAPRRGHGPGRRADRGRGARCDPGAGPRRGGRHGGAPALHRGRRRHDRRDGGRPRPGQWHTRRAAGVRRAVPRPRRGPAHRPAARTGSSSAARSRPR